MDDEQTLQWEIRSGIHTGTMMSREMEQHEKCASLEDCRTRFAARLRRYAFTSAIVWYAYAVGPKEERVELAPSVPYR